MRIYLFRHGIAVERERWSGIEAERPLTEAGRRRTERVAAVVDAVGIRPSLILSSPLLRAKSTAEILCRKLSHGAQVVFDERLGPGFGKIHLEAMALQYRNERELALVGHEPELSRVAGEVTGGSRLLLRKAGLVRIDLHFEPMLTGELVWLLSPKVMLRSHPRKGEREPSRDR